MVDQRVSKLAKLFVDYGVKVKPREKVIIQRSDRAYPLIDELYKACLMNDSYPQILATLDVEYTFFYLCEGTSAAIYFAVHKISFGKC